MGNRLVIDDVAGYDVYTLVDFRWNGPSVSGSFPGVPYTLSYTNGAGILPGPENPGTFCLTNTGTAISSFDSFLPVPGDFAFDAMMIEASFGPYAGSGTYTIAENQMVFSYILPGNVPDPGRFTRIVEARPTLTTSSTAGGSVTTPGEGDNDYDYGTVVDLAATPEPGYHFVNWTGPVADADAASTTVIMNADSSVQAHFYSFPWPMFLPAITNKAQP
jgi:hypothetical protein